MAIFHCWPRNVPLVAVSRSAAGVADAAVYACVCAPLLDSGLGWSGLGWAGVGWGGVGATHGTSRLISIAREYASVDPPMAEVAFIRLA